jgi:hypothetical protein
VEFVNRSTSIIILKNFFPEIFARKAIEKQLVVMELKCMTLYNNFSINRCIVDKNNTSITRCESVGKGGHCQVTQDCNPDQYCDGTMCKDIIKMGKACIHEEQCGRRGLCLYRDKKSLVG